MIIIIIADLRRLMSAKISPLRLLLEEEESSFLYKQNTPCAFVYSCVWADRRAGVGAAAFELTNDDARQCSANAHARFASQSGRPVGARNKGALSLYGGS